ncbi:MAG TPA: hypothetical protein ENI68_04950 [Gammaproteobacteria bacterium]|nr:hypothetical protein [Gammaproteobacteria bacterium]
MKTGNIRTFLVFFAFMLATAGAGQETWALFGGLKEEIQKELDGNPFLKKEGIKLRVVEEKNGYVTIEMYEGSRELRQTIHVGVDVDKIEGILLAGLGEHARRSTNAIRKVLSYVRRIEGVKEVLLTAEDPRARARIFWKKARRLYIEEQYDQCIDQASKAVRADPEYASVYRQRATCYRGKKQYAAALKDLEKALALKNSSVSLRALAWLFATSSDPAYQNGDKAMKYAQKAEKLRNKKMPASSFHLRTMAAAHARAGDFSNVVKWQQQAIERLRERYTNSRRKNPTELSRQRFEKRLAAYRAEFESYKNHQAYQE